MTEYYSPGNEPRSPATRTINPAGSPLVKQTDSEQEFERFLKIVERANRKRLGKEESGE